MESKNNLIIGYGNPLRCDDGVGQYVAEILIKKKLPDLHIKKLTQLTPELAELISASDLTIFIDVYHANKGEQVKIELLEPDDAPTTLDHNYTPQNLLNLAQTIYGHLPKSFIIKIPGFNFEYGDKLSKMTLLHALEVNDLILDLIKKTVSE